MAAMKHQVWKFLVAGIGCVAVFYLLYSPADNNTSMPNNKMAPKAKPAKLYENDQGEVAAAEFVKTDLSQEQIAALGEYALLREITFYECQGFEQSIDAELVKLKNITAVHFVRSSIDDSSLARLSKMPAVEHLTLSTVDVTSKGIETLGDWNRLKRLTLTGNIAPAALNGLSELRQLEHLELAITEGEARHLAGLALPGIRILSIADTGFSDADLSRLPAWTTLEVMEFPAENITDAGVVHLAKFPALKRLALSGSKVTDAGLVELHSLKQLEFLSLNGCPEVTNNGMRTLAKMPALKRLLIENSGVTGEGLMQLAPSESLRYVGIGETQASKAEVASLAAALPDRHVHRIQQLPGPGE